MDNTNLKLNIKLGQGQKQKPPRFLLLLNISMAGLLFVLALVSTPAYAANINKIIQIESSGNPGAFNKYSGARGLMQITPIVLKEYNTINHASYSLDDLYDPKVNVMVGSWYLDRIEKHYLKGVGSTADILICFNWGYGNFKKYIRGVKGLPLETKNYIKKYKVMR